MAILLARRLFALLATLAAVSVAIFLLMERTPGDAAEAQLGASATPERVEALRRELGIDGPPVERYFKWIGGVLVGDLGRSTAYGVPVADLVRERLVVTGPLTLLAMSMALAAALPLGVFGAGRPGGLVDLFGILWAQLGVAAPNFWIGVLLIVFVAAGTGILPAGGFPGWERGFWMGLRSLILPAAALAIPLSAVLLRVTRNAVGEAMNEDFVRTARAKGASLSRALWRHALPNAFAPALTMLGLQVSTLLVGAVLVEVVFTLPGLGQLIRQALAQRDYMVVRSGVLLLAAVIVLTNFIVDALYARLDPRLRASA